VLDDDIVVALHHRNHVVRGEQEDVERGRVGHVAVNGVDFATGLAYIHFDRRAKVGKSLLRVIVVGVDGDNKPNILRVVGHAGVPLDLLLTEGRSMARWVFYKDFHVYYYINDFF
jgi:hypothetical protein